MQPPRATVSDLQALVSYMLLQVNSALKVEICSLESAWLLTIRGRKPRRALALLWLVVSTWPQPHRPPCTLTDSYRSKRSGAAGYRGRLSRRREKRGGEGGEEEWMLTWSREFQTSIKWLWLRTNNCTDQNSIEQSAPKHLFAKDVNFSTYLNVTLKLT